jgi:hypothetical protein
LLALETPSSSDVMARVGEVAHETGCEGPRAREGESARARAREKVRGGGRERGREGERGEAATDATFGRAKKKTKK